ncbi:UNVERIFIED_CONTAM: Retrovirus-related Pol polyprotein from transposon RE1 [Sesamum angustifolium]|uniref:Retrovirus-related Pol polyprotein from transposon RE1 n=1 Tax=Sesamum angustifolium TaxID=2727405 RepID=A0AAW2MNA4_9LAMI
MPTPIPDVESIVHPSSVLPHSTHEPVPGSLDTMYATVHTPVVPAHSVPSTRLHRSITKPAWLQDYVCDHSSFPSNPCIPKMFLLHTGCKDYLDRLFSIKDLGFAGYFLGLELMRSSHGTYVTQCKYLRDILDDYKTQDAHFVSTPLPPGIRFDNASGVFLSSPDRYWQLVGRLLYLGFFRPDISFAVQHLSQFLQHP